MGGKGCYLFTEFIASGIQGKTRLKNIVQLKIIDWLMLL